MQFKPFRPPSFLGRSSQAAVPTPAPPADDIQNDRPVKKQRLSLDEDGDAVEEIKRPVTVTAPQSVPPSSQNGIRTPLASLRQSSQFPASSQTLDGSQQSTPKRTYSALYRKVTNKKHKTWDGDGIVVLSGGYAELKTDKGRYLGRTKCTDLDDVVELKIGGNDVEIGDLIENDASQGLEEDQVNEVSKPIFSRPMALTRPDKIPTELAPSNLVATRITIPNPASKIKRTISSTPKPKAFVNPLGDAASTLSRSNSNNTAPTPKHDPQGPDALVMRRPKSAPSGKQIVDVVVDPILCKRLREHQRAGVAFLYECVMGMRCREGAGAILADEMGLGKTLQTIALLWTLLKQNPIYGDGPVVRKAIIICPVSVAKNWRKEFRKWLGNERVGVLVLDEQNKIRSFTKGKSYQVCVVGYEMFNLVHKDLQKCDEIDIIIADEGHRLKTAKNKTATAIQSLNVERRVVLTGTPLQNDYSEWYSVVDFVNPGYLGKYNSFKKEFETPILRSRQQGASPEDLEKGEEADRELKRQTAAFILRRSADILSKYLPPKTETVLLCRPTTLQAKVYNTLLVSDPLSAAMRSPELSFQMINLLKKACNSPSLLQSDSLDPDSVLAQATAGIKPSELRTNVSGKLRVLDALLHNIRAHTDEKVVIMSNYTSTLNILGSLLNGMEYRFVRLDGSTPPAKRQGLVDEFNTSSADRLFAFLLSTKAGGIGLNLIGASRLILFDLDWNPALDAQAMARTHRDGQNRPCYIYRLVAKGAIEEKIFQRQCSKNDLAASVVDDRRSIAAFSQDALRDLFRVDDSPTCGTHDALGCRCAMDGLIIPAAVEDVNEDEELPDLPPAGRGDFVPASRMREASPAKDDGLKGLMQYAHLDAKTWRATARDEEQTDEAIPDAVLRRVVEQDGSAVDFIFTKRSVTSVGAGTP